MNHKCSLFIFVLLLTESAVLAQTADVKLDPPQAKITTVSAMRARGDPTIDAAEIMRLKLGTVVTTTAHSTAQDTIGGKTDFWYRVNLPNAKAGWVFGGLLLDYTPHRREQLLRQIIESRLRRRIRNSLIARKSTILHQQRLSKRKMQTRARNLSY